MEALKFHCPALIWGLCILFLSFLPGKDLRQLQLSDLLGFDKTIHAFFYSVLYFLSLIGLLKQYGYSNWRFISKWVLFVCIVYGIIIEILQPIVASDRYFDVLDIVANTVGCFVGIIIFNFVYQKILN